MSLQDVFDVVATFRANAADQPGLAGKSTPEKKLLVMARDHLAQKIADKPGGFVFAKAAGILARGKTLFPADPFSQGMFFAWAAKHGSDPEVAVPAGGAAGLMEAVDALAMQAQPQGTNSAIRFVGFGDADRHPNGVVDYTQAFADAKSLVVLGIAGVKAAAAAEAKQARARYETWFGPYDSHNAAVVKTHLTVIKHTLANTAADPWILRYDPNNKGALASFVSGRDITVGSSGFSKTAAKTDRDRGLAGRPGVLVHEIGHKVGLPDVCKNMSCHGSKLATKKSLEKLGQCTNNDAHGATDHFIGSVRCKELVKLNHFLTVWNTDSYRWFCEEFA